MSAMVPREVTTISQSTDTDFLQKQYTTISTQTTAQDFNVLQALTEQLGDNQPKSKEVATECLILVEEEIVQREKEVLEKEFEQKIRLVKDRVQSVVDQYKKEIQQMNRDYLELEGKYQDAQSLLEMLYKQTDNLADDAQAAKSNDKVIKDKKENQQYILAIEMKKEDDKD